MTQSDAKKNQPPEEEGDTYGLKTPSGFISSEQMSSLLESAAKSAGHKNIRGPGPHKEFKSSGKNIDEPPSGFIPSGQMSTLLEGASQSSAAHAHKHPPKPSQQSNFQPSNKGIDEPPSGFIPSAQMSSLLGANQSKDHKAHHSDKASWSSQPLPGLRPPSQDAKPVVRKAAESGAEPLRVAPAKKGCFGVLLLPLLGLGAWCALHAWI